LGLGGSRKNRTPKRFPYPNRKAEEKKIRGEARALKRSVAGSLLPVTGNKIQHQTWYSSYWSPATGYWPPNCTEKSKNNVPYRIQTKAVPSGRMKMLPNYIHSSSNLVNFSQSSKLLIKSSSKLSSLKSFSSMAFSFIWLTLIPYFNAFPIITKHLPFRPCFAY
jgi:hypothetical protein